ncbi:MAG: hypothetical protein WCH31_07930 [Actinomycetes bacterium]
MPTNHEPALSAREALEASVSEYRHARDEHRRTHEHGSARRHLDDRLARIVARFERQLAGAEISDVMRDEWRAHLYHGAPAPAEPEQQAPAGNGHPLPHSSRRARTRIRRTLSQIVAKSQRRV